MDELYELEKKKSSLREKGEKHQPVISDRIFNLFLGQYWPAGGASFCSYPPPVNLGGGGGDIPVELKVRTPNGKPTSRNRNQNLPHLETCLSMIHFRNYLRFSCKDLSYSRARHHARDAAHQSCQRALEDASERKIPAWKWSPERWLGSEGTHLARNAINCLLLMRDLNFKKAKTCGLKSRLIFF